MSNQAHTPEQAFNEFAGKPLVSIVGVDRASWLAGYETCSEHLQADRAKLVEVLRYYANQDHGETARALLRELGELK